MSKFALLLTTYNGEAHLSEQLTSLDAQTVADIDVWHSDDGSTDATPGIVAKAAERWRKGAFHTLHGPRAGFAENFRSIIGQSGIDADFVAFCDQDDVWDADKLEVAERHLGSVQAGRPGLYCSRTRLIGDEGAPVGFSPLMRRPPSFRNALVQSIAGGNTMVMNRAAFDLVRSASTDTPFVSHDWWSYLLVSGAGGTVIYDPVPHISYRQHEQNLVGANMGLNARLQRYRLVLSGRFARWNTMNLAGLATNAAFLTPENLALAQEFDRARKADRGSLVRTIIGQRLRRQTYLGDVTLLVGSLLGKM